MQLRSRGELPDDERQDSDGFIAKIFAAENWWIDASCVCDQHVDQGAAFVDSRCEKFSKRRNAGRQTVYSW